MLKLLDLFSGIGGFSLGMEATNRIKTIAFVEKDKFCQKVLSKNFKNIPIEEDIRNVKGSNYAADIVSGGFPCQPFSVAGKRKGKDDDRYLWDETIRVVAETKPRWFVGENVEGIINISNGTILQQIQKDLEAENFQVQCLVIPASGVGAWHQRKRVWIIAHSNSNGNTNEITRSYGKKEKIQKEHRQEYNSAWKFIGTDSNDVPNTNSGFGIRKNEEIQARGNAIDSSSKNVSNTNAGNVEAGCERQWGVCSEGQGQGSSSNAANICKTLSNTKKLRSRRWSSEECGIEERKFQQIKQEGSKVWSKIEGCGSQNVWHSKSSRRKSSSDRQRERELWGTSTSRVQRQRTWWEVESEFCGVPYGLSSRLDKDRTNRIKALGNSIVPQIAYEIGKAIVDAENQSD